MLIPDFDTKIFHHVSILNRRLNFARFFIFCIISQSSSKCYQPYDKDGCHSSIRKVLGSNLRLNSYYSVTDFG
jgi:hypothetical protein